LPIWQAETGPSGRGAAVRELSGAEDPDKGSLPVQLLADVAVVFEARKAEQLSSAELVEALTALAERPWCEGRS